MTGATAGSGTRSRADRRRAASQGPRRSGSMHGVLCALAKNQQGLLLLRKSWKMCKLRNGSVEARLVCIMALVRDEWHRVSVGRRQTRTAGHSGLPNSAQRKSGSSCTHFTPAGFPCGIPGIGDVIDGAMQHAPQRERHSMLTNHGRPASWPS